MCDNNCRLVVQQERKKMLLTEKSEMERQYDRIMDDCRQQEIDLTLHAVAAEAKGDMTELRYVRRAIQSLSDRASRATRMIQEYSKRIDSLVEEIDTTIKKLEEE